MVKLFLGVNMKIYAERLKKLRVRKNLSLRSLAKELNKILPKEKQIHFSTLGNYEQGRREPSIALLKILADFFDVSVDYLVGAVRNPKSKISGEASLYMPERQKEIPLLGKVSAGEGMFAKENVESYIPVAEGDPADFALRVDGHSMFPLFRDGDVVFVKKQSTASNGQLAVVIINGEDGVIKRFYKRKNEIILISENPDYKTIKIKSSEWENECEITGVITGFKRNFNNI